MARPKRDGADRRRPRPAVVDPAALSAEAVVNQAYVEEVLGVSDRTIRHMVKEGFFPEGVPVGKQNWFEWGELTGKVLARFRELRERKRGKGGAA